MTIELNIFRYNKRLVYVGAGLHAIWPLVRLRRVSATRLSRCVMTRMCVREITRSF